MQAQNTEELAKMKLELLRISLEKQLNELIDKVWARGHPISIHIFTC